MEPLHDERRTNGPRRRKPSTENRDPAVFKGNELQVGDLIANGQLQIKVPAIVLSEKQIAVQKIKPKSGWVLSTDTVNSSRIRALNRQIGEQQIRKTLPASWSSKTANCCWRSISTEPTEAPCTTPARWANPLPRRSPDWQLQMATSQAKTSPSGIYKLTDYQNYHPAKENITIKNLLTMRRSLQGSDMQESSPRQ